MVIPLMLTFHHGQDLITCVNVYERVSEFVLENEEEDEDITCAYRIPNPFTAAGVSALSGDASTPHSSAPHLRSQTILLSALTHSNNSLTHLCPNRYHRCRQNRGGYSLHRRGLELQRHHCGCELWCDGHGHVKETLMLVLGNPSHCLMSGAQVAPKTRGGTLAWAAWRHGASSSACDSAGVAASELCCAGADIRRPSPT